MYDQKRTGRVGTCRYLIEVVNRDWLPYRTIHVVGSDCIPKHCINTLKKKEHFIKNIIFIWTGKWTFRNFEIWSLIHVRYSLYRSLSSEHMFVYAVGMPQGSIIMYSKHIPRLLKLCQKSDLSSFTRYFKSSIGAFSSL